MSMGTTRSNPQHRKALCCTLCIAAATMPPLIACGAPDRRLGPEPVADAAGLDASGGSDASPVDAAAGGSGGIDSSAGTDGSAGKAVEAGFGGGSGQSGAGGAGGAGADAGSGGASCGCNSLETCISGGLCVAALVDVGDGYSIDVTEVTWKQYEAWTMKNPSTSGLPQECAFKTSFVPGYPFEQQWWSYPVNRIDWCDAYAYCKSVGKRLCGKRGGGAVPYAAFADATVSQWHNACSSGGANNYPYGGAVGADASDGYDPSACAEDAPAPVASFPACVASPAGKPIYDLSGNNWEWEDSCEAASGPTDHCRMRGGAIAANAEQLTCGYDSTAYPTARNFRGPTVTFRCCQP